MVKMYKQFKCSLVSEQLRKWGNCTVKYYLTIKGVKHLYNFQHRFPLKLMLSERNQA